MGDSTGCAKIKYRQFEMPGSHVYGFVVFLYMFSLRSVIAWGNEELELFDLVEEVNQNFYEVLGVDQVLSRF